MATYKEKEELANGFSWTEILYPANLSQVKRIEHPGGLVIDWEAQDGRRFRTFGEAEHLFSIEDGEINLKVPPVSKLDAIRLLHFNGDGRVAGLFLESGRPLFSTALDEIAFERNEERLERLFRVNPKARYTVDRGFQVRVDNARLGIEASDEARRQITEALFARDKKTPSARLLDEFIAEELEPETFLVEGLIPFNSTCTLVAARKTGKSTFVYNLIHALISGEPLLGFFETKKLERRVGYVNFELTETQAQDWFKRSGIRPTDQVAIWNLRGHPNPFRSQTAIDQFAEEVKALDIRVLILDPFSSAFRGDSQNNDEVKRFFLMTDAFKEASGVSELIIPVHAGWDTTRVRGASTLDDHPDAIMHLEKSKDGVRSFSAFGRDVDVKAGELTFDSQTLLLKYKGATTEQVKRDKLMIEIIDFVNKNHEVNATAIRQEIEASNYQIDKARDAAVSKGLLSVRQVRNAKLYAVTSAGHAYSPSLAPGESASVTDSKELVSPPIYRGDTLTSPFNGTCECGLAFGEPVNVGGIKVEVCWDCFGIGAVEALDQGIAQGASSRSEGRAQYPNEYQDTGFTHS